MAQVTFDANGNPIQPSGFRRTGSGALQFVATPHTTMNPDQWSQCLEQAGARADQVLDNAERVGVIAPGSRDMRLSVGGR